MDSWVELYWKQVSALIAFVVWLVRLESRSEQNAREIRRIWHQRKEDMETAKQSRQETSAMLSEIRDDIKALIAKVGS